MNRRVYLIVILNSMLLFFSGNILAQDVPVGSLPTLYNGGFAGEAGTARLASFSELRVPQSPLLYRRQAQHISYDDFFKKIRSGFGIRLSQVRDARLSHDAANTAVSMAWSVKFSSAGKTTFAPFVDFTFLNSKFTRIDSSHYFNIPEKHNYLGVLRTGFLYNWKRAYFGVSVDALKFTKEGDEYGHRMNRFGTEALDGFALVLQGGYTFQRKPTSRFSFTPQAAISYRSRYGAEFHDVNLAFRYKKILFGINGSGLMLGFQNERFRLQTTQHYRSSSYFGYNYHATLSLRYIFVK